MLNRSVLKDKRIILYRIKIKTRMKKKKKKRTERERQGRQFFFFFFKNDKEDRVELSSLVVVYVPASQTHFLFGLASRIYLASMLRFHLLI